MHSSEIASPTKGLVILKIDMEKTYDRVHWPFLFTILAQFGFYPRFVYGLEELASRILTYLS